MNANRLVMISSIVFFLIVIGGLTGYYFYNQSTLYLKTDNAQVTGQVITITAPASGKLENWKGLMNSKFSAGNTVGQIEVAGQNGSTTTDIPMPQDSTIVENNAVNNEFVVPGTPLARAYDMNNLWVVANINETDINNVNVGEKVDVYVDGVPGVTFNGTVSDVGKATLGTFSMLPSSSSNANFTKVTQVIPVKITLQVNGGSGLSPGMSATVRIHK